MCCSFIDKTLNELDLFNHFNEIYNQIGNEINNAKLNKLYNSFHYVKFQQYSDNLGKIISSV